MAKPASIAGSPPYINPDFLILGAGIVRLALALARKLKRRYPDQQVTTLE